MSDKKHYVNNKALYNEFVEYAKLKEKSLAEGKGVPQLTPGISKAILAIANKVCYSPKFVNYTSNWKEEMIGDGIEVCVRYAHNFDPDEYDNPFAYITQMITNAFIQRINKEKRQLYYKYKMFDECGGFEALLDDNVKIEDLQTSQEFTDVYRDHLEFIHTYEENAKEKREMKQKKVEDNEPKGVDAFL